MRDSRIMLLEWTHALPSATSPHGHIVTRRIRVTVFTLDSEAESTLYATERECLNFDDDEARDCAFLHQLSEIHVRP